MSDTKKRRIWVGGRRQPTLAIISLGLSARLGIIWNMLHCYTSVEPERPAERTAGLGEAPSCCGCCPPGLGREDSLESCGENESVRCYVM